MCVWRTCVWRRSIAGKGAARLLVEAIRERHPQRLGIKAKCRRDYKLSEMWAGLGFVPRGEVRGRGRRGEILDGWWLDLGHPDLFAGVESDALLVVTVDHGVFAGLRGRVPASDAAEAQALDAGWLSDLVELALAPRSCSSRCGISLIRQNAGTSERLCRDYDRSLLTRKLWVFAAVNCCGLLRRHFLSFLLTPHCGGACSTLPRPPARGSRYWLHVSRSWPSSLT